MIKEPWGKDNEYIAAWIAMAVVAIPFLISVVRKLMSLHMPPSKAEKGVFQSYVNARRKPEPVRTQYIVRDWKSQPIASAADLLAEIRAFLTRIFITDWGLIFLGVLLITVLIAGGWYTVWYVHKYPNGGP